LTSAVSRKQKISGHGNGDDDSDFESLDWWAKYHASAETAIRVGRA